MARKALLREFQHQRRRERPVGVHELQICGKNSASFSVAAGDVAEQADLAVLERQPAHHLHAAEQQQLVDPRHQAAALGQLEELGRQQLAPSAVRSRVNAS